MNHVAITSFIQGGGGISRTTHVEIVENFAGPLSDRVSEPIRSSRAESFQVIARELRGSTECA